MKNKNTASDILLIYILRSIDFYKKSLPKRYDIIRLSIEDSLNEIDNNTKVCKLSKFIHLFKMSREDFDKCVDQLDLI